MADVLTGKPAGDTQRDIAARDVSALVTSAAGTVTYTMTTTIRHIEVIQASGYAMAVMLPPVAVCAGMIFSVVVRTYVDAPVTVADAGDDALFTTRSMAANTDYWVGYSDGRRWLTLSDTDASKAPALL